MQRTILRIACVLLALPCLAEAGLHGLAAKRQMQANDDVARGSVQGTLADVVSKNAHHVLADAGKARVDLSRATWGGNFPGFGAGGTVVVPAWPAGGKLPKVAPVAVASQRPEWVDLVRQARAVRSNPQKTAAFKKLHRAALMSTVHVAGLALTQADLDTLNQATVTRAAGGTPTIVVIDGYQPDVDAPSLEARLAASFGGIALLLGCLAAYKPKQKVKLPSAWELGIEPLTVVDADSIKMKWKEWEGARYTLDGKASQPLTVGPNGNPVFKNATTANLLLDTPAQIVRRSRTLMNELFANAAFQNVPQDQRNITQSVIVQDGLAAAAITAQSYLHNEAGVMAVVEVWKACVMTPGAASKNSVVQVAVDLDPSTRLNWVAQLLADVMSLEEKQHPPLVAWLRKCQANFNEVGLGYGVLVAG